MQNKEIRTVCVGFRTRQSYNPYGKKIQILTFQSICIFKTINNFVQTNLHLFNSTKQTKNIIIIYQDLKISILTVYNVFWSVLFNLLHLGTLLNKIPISLKKEEN